MIAITLYEPYATLVSIRAKRFETRSWNVKFTGPIAIHAGLKREGVKNALQRDPFRSVLAMHGICREQDFPLGCVVCVAWLASCRPSDILRLEIDHDEQDFGDFSDGRFGWELSDVMRLNRPDPAKGSQGLWQWNPSDNLRPLIDEWEQRVRALRGEPVKS